MFVYIFCLHFVCLQISEQRRPKQQQFTQQQQQRFFQQQNGQFVRHQ